MHGDAGGNLSTAAKMLALSTFGLLPEASFGRFRNTVPMDQIFRRSALVEQGYSARMIERLVREGSLQRVSQGWYAMEGADEALTLAAQAHTRLGCLSAAQYHSLWVPKPRVDFVGNTDPKGTMCSYVPSSGQAATDIHVLLNNWDSGEMTKKRVWKATGGRSRACLHRWPGSKEELVASVEDAVEQVSRWHGSETALVVIESALNQGRVSEEWVCAMLERLPPTVAHRLRNFQVLSESGSETRVAHHFRRRGVKVQQQAQITPNIRVDALVGQSLVVESDSIAFHGALAAYIHDRRRAATLEELGYNVVELSYEQIWDHWGDTVRMLNSLIKQRKHLKKVRTWAG